MEALRGLRGHSYLLIAAALVFGAAIVAEAGRPKVTREAPWDGHIRAVDEALAMNDVGSAQRAWHDAHVAALGSWRWEGMIEVGDAVLRIGEATGLRRAAEARARQAYLTAFFRARDQESLDGVLRAAEAFAALGDRNVVAKCLAVADGLAARLGSAQARERVHEFAARWASMAWAAEILGAP